MRGLLMIATGTCFIALAALIPGTTEGFSAAPVGLRGLLLDVRGLFDAYPLAAYTAAITALATISAA